MRVLTALASLMLLLAGFPTDTSAQTEMCRVTHSQIMVGFYDVHCNCNQALREDVSNIHILTINQTDCEQFNVLNISWTLLERVNQPKHIRFVGSQIILNEPPANEWNTTLQKIEFIQCTFQIIPARAFTGLSLLTELRFSNNYIGSIDPYAISNLPNLQTLEFSDSDIVEISSFAISGLSNLHDIAFVRSNVNMMRQNCTHNLMLPRLPITPDCPDIDIRTSRRRDENLMGTIARSLDSIDNLPLPKFGARFIVYESNITYIEESAIESDMFAFILIGGSNIDNIAEKSFNVELTNQCEISALIMVENKFRRIQPRALAFVTGRRAASHNTYFVMNNNTFEYVAAMGFHLHHTVSLYPTLGNKFICQCHFLEWANIDMMESTPKQELALSLYDGGQCVGRNMNVKSFRDTCKNTDYPTPDNVIMTMPDEIPTTTTDEIPTTTPDEIPTTTQSPTTSTTTESSSAESSLVFNKMFLLCAIFLTKLIL